MKGRPIKDDAYENLLNYYNKKSQQTQCECGKLVPTTRLNKHMKSNLHERLTQLKNRANQVNTAISASN